MAETPTESESPAPIEFEMEIEKPLDLGKIKIPGGIEDILNQLYKETLREQPQDVVPFIAKLLEVKLNARNSERAKEGEWILLPMFK